MIVHSVSELNGFIADCLKDVFGNDRVVEGEVSEFKPYASGHWYFTLKDPESDPTSTLKCVMWRSAVAKVKVPFRLGERVRLFGGIAGYAVNGTYQFNTLRFERSGAGDLAQRLEELRARLGAEGLFDPDKKRPLPRFPRTVGIATARDSAALADMLRIIGDRYPVSIVLAPCRVQGEGSAADIARAVRWLNQDPRVDVIIVGRGGGSAEDLFAFNEEVAVRAVAASRVPIISAVGHESDQCLCDLAADLRAPTPSAAAKAVVPDAADLERGLDVSQDRLDGAVARVVARQRERLRAVRLVHPKERVERARRDCVTLATRLQGLGGRASKVQRERLAAAERRLDPAAQRVVRSSQDRLGKAQAGLQALSPLRVLDRGYAIVQYKGGVMRSASEATVGETLSVRFATGSLGARVESISSVPELNSNNTGGTDAEG